MADSVGHILRPSRTIGVEDAHRDDLGAAQPRDAQAVVRDRRDLTGHVRAVPVGVDAAVAPGTDRGGVADEVLAEVAAHPPGEVLVGGRDAGVHDADLERGAVRRPGRELRDVEGVERPLVGAVGIDSAQRRDRRVDRHRHDARLLAQVGLGLRDVGRVDLAGDDLGTVVRDHERGDRRELVGGRRRGVGLGRRHCPAHDQDGGDGERGQGGASAEHGHTGAGHAERSSDGGYRVSIDLRRARLERNHPSGSSRGPSVPRAPETSRGPPACRAALRRSPGRPGPRPTSAVPTGAGLVEVALSSGRANRL
jgi:hypothetical protein